MAHNAIMTHCISHFPNKESYRRIVQALLAGGSSYIEVQFPFSDPSADGPVIQDACEHAIHSGNFTVEDAFSTLQTLTTQCTIPFFVMTYANVVFRFGIKAFVQRCKDAGVRGIIVPDLPFDASESLFQIAKEHAVEMIPVLTISSPSERIIAYAGSTYAYVSLRTGITGKETRIDAAVLHKLDKIKRCFPMLIGGFGIHSPEQVAMLAAHLDIIVVGSAIFRVFAAYRDGKYFEAIKDFVASLVQA